MIVLGRLVAPYGVRGWLRVHPFGDEPVSWQAMRRWRLSPDAEAAPASWVEYALDDMQAGGNRLAVKLAGVDDRTAAEALVGQYFGALRSDLPKPGANEYYWNDLIGLQVVNEQGEALGKVVSLVETGAHEVLVVRDGDTERLLPFVQQVVKKVDVPGASIRVDWGSDW